MALARGVRPGRRSPRAAGGRIRLRDYRRTGLASSGAAVWGGMSHPPRRIDDRRGVQDAPVTRDVIRSEVSAIGIRVDLRAI